MYFCYTDGSCKSGNAGAPGGWGFCIKQPDGSTSEGHGNAVKTLSKVMEYTAVAEALAALPAGVEATVFSDSQSLVESCRKRIDAWRQGQGWSKVDPEILGCVQRLAAVAEQKQLALTWQWIRGHNGNAGNERADALATEGAREAKAALEAEEKAARKKAGGG
ncbi:MAG TPA: RNase H family protein [Myxococcales bacterium]|jgi:ribonuclease HI